MPRLAAYVHVAGRVFGPADDVPAEFAAQITNPKAWVGGKVPATEPAPAPQADGDGPSVDVPLDTPTVVGRIPEGNGGSPPPRSGPGSSAPVWRAYARRHGVEVPVDAKRDDVIAALDAAGVPTEGEGSS